ncbi:hypothetical protein [Actinomadura alba]|uniref:Uncharacterized protein n=1 Tax=Actinomadura alba TaxID=406431 RepID=A0ABR7LSA3_9ACTN|nr:hypothetical protein [Actinomadura alba]MBC6467735.1 hypothetical protein [Actinomadura alba]
MDDRRTAFAELETANRSNRRRRPRHAPLPEPPTWPQAFVNDWRST